MVKYKKYCTEKTEDYFVFSINDEYPGAEIEERWIVASDLTEAQLLAKYAQLKKYQPFIALTMEQGRDIYECNMYEDRLDRLERRHCISLDVILYEDMTCGWMDPQALVISDDSENEQIYAMIRKGFARMNPSQQKLVYALFYQGKTQEEYAREFGISQAAISQNLRKIKNFLKNFLKTAYNLPSK